MPPADFRAYVIGAKSGHVRSNKSWIIGRLLRDYEQQADPLCTEKDSRDWEALRVAVYRTAPSTQSGRPVRDWVWFSGLGMIFVQLSIAIVPLCLFGDFIVLFVTVAANALTLSHGLSAQWKKEKWACPKGGGHTVTITQGNGSRHAMVILGGREALDLSILAYCDGNSSCSSATRILAAVQSTCWGALLLTVAGLKQGAWCKFSKGWITSH